MDNKKLERKPYRLLNPLDNTSKYESLSKIKENLREIDILQSQFDNHIKIIDVPNNKGGVPLYYQGNKLYVDETDSHTLIIGATGSKKTRLIVLPTCLILAEARESMIITDPKAEIYNRTAKKFQELGYKIEVLNFREPSMGNCWNPFSIPHAFYKKGEKDRAYEFVNDIGTNLFLSQLNQRDPFWDYSASDLFFGLTTLAMRLSDEEHEVNIRDIFELRHKFFLGDNGIDEDLLKIAKENLVTSQSLLGIVTAPERTRDSILATFDQKMRFFSFQDNLLEMLSKTTVSMDTIGTQKTVIYLIMPDEKTTLHPLISLFVKQSYEYLIYLVQDYDHEGKYEIRINYILDEFSALPKIGDFPAMITAARSRNIRFNLIIQSGNQLKKRYEEEASTIKGNCNNWVFLYSKEVEILEEISKLCGLDDKSMPMVSILALQHMSKEKGEAIVLSNRLFPIFAHLQDISFFDDEQYQIIPFEKRPSSENKSKYALWPKKTTVDNSEDLKKRTSMALRELSEVKEQLRRTNKMKEKVSEENEKLKKELWLIKPNKGSIVLGVYDIVSILICICTLQYFPILNKYISWPIQYSIFLFVTVYSVCILLVVFRVKYIIMEKLHRTILFGGFLINAFEIFLAFFFVPDRNIEDNVIIITVISAIFCNRFLSNHNVSFEDLSAYMESGGTQSSINPSRAYSIVESIKINAILDGIGKSFLILASIGILFYTSNNNSFRIVFFVFTLLSIINAVFEINAKWKEKTVNVDYYGFRGCIEIGYIFVYILVFILMLLHRIYV